MPYEAASLWALGLVARLRADPDADGHFTEALRLLVGNDLPLAHGFAHLCRAALATSDEREAHLANARRAWEDAGELELVARYLPLARITQSPAAPAAQ